MARRIKLTFAEPSRATLTGRDVFRLQVTASNAEEMPNEIFLHQRTVYDYSTDNTCDEFVCIASAFDLSIYPANAPDEEQTPQFFRKSTVDILLPSVTVVDSVADEIRAQVSTLVDVLNTLDVISEEQVFWYPSAP